MLTAAAPVAPAPPDVAGDPRPAAQLSGNTLGQEAFLTLLITQIQMQDPLDPLSATEYVTQLAQFSTVEQLQNTNISLSVLCQAQATSQALLLVGHNVATADGGVSGLVEAVVFSDGQPKLLIGGQEVDPSDVVRVW
jgi:flagellar basal-body rod modification protein FlgD